MTKSEASAIIEAAGFERTDAANGTWWKHADGTALTFCWGSVYCYDTDEWMSSTDQLAEMFN